MADYLDMALPVLKQGDANQPIVAVYIDNVAKKDRRDQSILAKYRREIQHQQ